MKQKTVNVHEVVIRLEIDESDAASFISDWPKEQISGKSPRTRLGSALRNMLDGDGLTHCLTGIEIDGEHQRIRG